MQLCSVKRGMVPTGNFRMILLLSVALTKEGEYSDVPIPFRN